MISGEVIVFIENTMKNCKVELTAGGKSLDEVKIQEGIFQRDMVSSLLFVIAIVPLNHILWKCTGGSKFHKSQEKKINHLMYMDDIKICHANNEKRKTTYDGGDRTTKSRKIRTLGEKETYKILGNTGSGHHQTCGDERKKKKKKKKTQENEKAARNQTTYQKSQLRNKYLGCLPRRSVRSDGW